MTYEGYSYRKLSVEQDKENSESILQDSSNKQPIVTSRAIFYVIFHILLLTTYLFGTSILLDHAFYKRKAYGVSEPTPYSPARDVIRYVEIPFNAAPDLTSPYVGESRPSLDEAWHNLVQYTNMRISEKDLQAVNRTSIPLGKGGGYYGEMAVFHELHCVKFIRQAFHMDHYANSFGDIEKQKMGEHIEHCIEILRQSVMCRGDTTLITFHWGHTVKLPQPDFTLPHKCVDWNALMEWAKDHAVDVFEEGMLVHPTLGPSYPGGFREDRPRPPMA